VDGAQPPGDAARVAALGASGQIRGDDAAGPPGEQERPPPPPLLPRSDEDTDTLDLTTFPTLLLYRDGREVRRAVDPDTRSALLRGLPELLS
jgi:hypothetical protein